MESVVYAVGLAMGCVMLGSVCYVWVQKQEMGLGGGVLTAFGVVLLGLSVWTGVSVEVSKDGIKADFDRLQERLEEVTEANRVVSEQVEAIARGTETNRRQFVELTEVLESEKRPAAQSYLMLRESAVGAPEVDFEKLRRATDTLGKPTDLEEPSQ